MNKEEIIFRVHYDIRPDRDKYFGKCINLDGVYVEGDTKKETRLLLREAIKVHLQTLVINNLPIPKEIISVESFQSEVPMYSHHKTTEAMEVAVV
ncbi:MAG: type II toxin-antitoxin system HicB family antitoxin [Aestuariivita sp.]|nr:type II toxin-antitoxin system HicB family antitoxin [Aestuariivita sp.]